MLLYVSHNYSLGKLCQGRNQDFAKGGEGLKIEKNLQHYFNDVF